MLSILSKSIKVDQAFEKLIARFGYQKKVKLISIDFQKPLWDIFWQQKTLVFINFLNHAVGDLTATAIPIIIGYAIQTQNFNNFVYCLVAITLTQFLAFILYYFNHILRLQTSQSIVFSANKFFLITDPINHSSRSSGQILAKVNRGAESIDSLITILSFEFLSLFFVILGTVVSFGLFDFIYGLIVLCGWIVLVTFNVFAALYKKKFEQLLITFSDLAQSINVETMQQAFYIRSSFASNEQIDKIQTKTLKNIYTDATSRRLTDYIIFASQLMFALNFGLLGWLILKDDRISLVLTVSLLISYFNAGSKFFNVGLSVNELIKSYVGVVDLYEFIRKFGKQTYPVLEGDKPGNIAVQ